MASLATGLASAWWIGIQAAPQSAIISGPAPVPLTATAKVDRTISGTPPIPTRNQAVATALPAGPDKVLIKIEEPATAPMPVPEKMAKNSAKPHTSRLTVAAMRKDRNEEIDRIRTQAFSETRKDRLSRIRAPAKVPATSRRFRPSAKVASARSELTQCGRNANFFHRERCKWRVCGGRWGQNGCPSYDHKQASLS
jgi:hypothetical protein